MQWFRNLFTRQAPAPIPAPAVEAPEPPDPNENRRIFKFWDGQRWTTVDPMVAYRGITGHKDYRSVEDPQLAEAGDDEAIQRMVQCARDVFAVKPYDGATGEGMTEGETVDLMVSFSLYLGELKKNTSPSLIGSAVTASAPTA